MSKGGLWCQNETKWCQNSIGRCSVKRCTPALAGFTAGYFRHCGLARGELETSAAMRLAWGAAAARSEWRVGERLAARGEAELVRAWWLAVVLARAGMFGGA
jgi:hypothetical protein